MRTIENVSISYKGYESSEYYTNGYLYGLEYKYIGKCNGTKVIF